MIKVVCINKGLYREYFDEGILEDGKQYEAEFMIGGKGIRIPSLNKVCPKTGSVRSFVFFFEWAFVTLEDWREKQMKSILDD